MDRTTRAHVFYMIAWGAAAAIVSTFLWWWLCFHLAVIQPSSIVAFLICPLVFFTAVLVMRRTARGTYATFRNHLIRSRRRPSSSV